MSEADPLRFVRSDFRELEEYVPVKPLDVLAQEIGMPAGQLVKLDANENLYGVIPEVREAIAAAPLHIYPDPGQGALREAIAGYAGVGPGQVVAGAGADDLIDVVIRLVGPEAVVIATPTFGMYGFLAKITRSRVVESPRGPGFAPDLDDIERAVGAGARIVFLASPNNPTGNLLSHGEIGRLCAMDALIVVDEAYIEFSGHSATPLLAKHGNLVILRTFSKWAGLAGLRVGYSLSHPGLASRMMAIKQPYNVNVAADVAARAALEHRGRIFETVRCIVEERERMARLVGELGWLTPLPSSANFVLFEVKGRSAAGVSAALRRRGVLVRYYDRPDLQNYIRISAGRPEDTGRLLAALRAVEAQ
ncbi:MAG: histidinol-phosphate transaminase [Thermoflexaceae bacterium]|nr:histidinol-phosphate transaminase [Thermoflexaceae bacterium]